MNLGESGKGERWNMLLKSWVPNWGWWHFSMGLQWRKRYWVCLKRGAWGTTKWSK